ncbi:hypothetical protein WH50_09310 [Pokkaliibacter plantistimulans]|uniref:TonB C-terminal domain-containing protein n=1 Tax=Pokkaliibacter plantistimulans TaxID=1635171 RepID=A0ABX5M1E8_9GAMM|nr:hypothetical protein [Pokkaliibacter plantistimulans]PXF31553.1 hypothetical protein WH50_09310 [Pokkaliibacter plantistimulans]
MLRDANNGYKAFASFERDQGKLKVSVLQDARGQAREAVNVALKLFWGSPPVESLNWIPFKLITPENAAEFK